MAATNEAIAAAMLEFIIKVIDNKNKDLQCHAIYLIDNLKLLKTSYLTEHNLMSIKPIVRSLE